MDLDLKHRPKTLKQVRGQDNAIRVIRGLFKKGFPHKVLFTGPSGCGKTTLARIVAKKLECDDVDFNEVNCADFRGVDTIRDIRRVMGLSPMAGKCRIWLIDEAHKLTNDAQTAMLKMVEEPPKHVYFLLATTDPQKLIRTVQTRLTTIAVNSLSDNDLRDLIAHVNTKEHSPLANDDIADKIVELADGSARQAVKLFESVMGIEGAKQQVQALERQDSKRQAIEIARKLCNPRVRYEDVRKILKEVDEEPEKIRHMILGYFSAITLKGGKLVPRAMQLIEIFRDNWYDCGRAGLLASCYAACNAR